MPRLKIKCEQDEFARLAGGVRLVKMKVAWLKTYKRTFHIGNTCYAIGITRSCFNQWKHNDPNFKECVENVLEGCIDNCEANICKATKSTDKDAWERVKFFLQHKALHRGYGEPNMEVKVDGGMKLTIVSRVLKDEKLDDSEKESKEAPQT